MNSTLQYLAHLRNEAEATDSKFNQSNYLWVLGVRVINDIANEIPYFNHRATSLSLFGILIKSDCYNLDNIQLWRNITDNLRGKNQ